MGQAIERFVIVTGDVGFRARIFSLVRDQGVELHFSSSLKELVASVPPRRSTGVVVVLDQNVWDAFTALGELRSRAEWRGAPFLVCARTSPVERPRLEAMSNALGHCQLGNYPPTPEEVAQWTRRANETPQAVTTAEPPVAVASPSRQVAWYESVLTPVRLREVHLDVARMSHFERLGVAEHDDERAVRAAYQQRVALFREMSTAKLTEEDRRLLRECLESLGMAYRTLLDPGKRHAYAMQLRSHASPVRERPAPAARPGSTTPPPGTHTAVPPRPGASSSPNVRTAMPPRPGSVTPSPETHTFVAMQGRHGMVHGGEEFVPRSKRPMGAPSRPTSATSTPSPELARPGTEDDHDIWDQRHVQKAAGLPEELSEASQVQAAMGNYEGAVELMTQCMKLEPSNDDYRYRLELYQGRRFVRAGNNNRARRHFELAAALAPSGTNAAQEELDELNGVVKKKAAASGSLMGKLGDFFGGKR